MSHARPSGLTRKLALIGSPGTNGCNRAWGIARRIFGQVGGAVQIEGIHRPGAVNRLEDGRVFESLGQPLTRNDRDAKAACRSPAIEDARPAEALSPVRSTAVARRAEDSRAGLLEIAASIAPGLRSSPARSER